MYRGVVRVPVHRPASLSVILIALGSVASLSFGCASRVVVDDAPPRRPATTSSLPPPSHLAARPQVPAPQPAYRWNQSPSRIQEGAGRPAAAGRATSVAGQRSVVVQPGDTLYTLSGRYRVSMAAMMEANRMRSPVVQPGQILVLPR